ncbi:hypothetical protein BBP40_003316 [Aspergillus hancockii]|nr:hypothetical protein BBP40_003316 [Aspergillus hancockii]
MVPETPPRSLGGPERSALIEQITGIIPDHRNKDESLTTRLFKCQVNDKDLWLLDTPTPVIHITELQESINKAVAGPESYSVDGVVYLHDITDTNVTRNAEENLAVFQGIPTPASRNNVVIVSTFWDLLRTSEEGICVEDELREVYGRDASIFRVMDSSDRVSYWNIVSDLVGRLVEGSHKGGTAPSVEELLSIIDNKDRQVAYLGMELQATKEASARQLWDMQQKAAEEKDTLTKQIQQAVREISKLEEELRVTKEDCASQVSQLQERLDTERRESDGKLRDLETKRLSLAQELDKSMSRAASHTPEYLRQNYSSSGQTSNLNVLDARGEFPLYGAAAGGNYDEVKRMLQQGANPSMRTRFNWTALHWAVGNGHNMIVELLLDYGADINAISDTGSTPLCMAQTDIMKCILYNRGASF